MRTVTREQFKKLYGDGGLASFGGIETKQTKNQEPKLTEIVGQDINERVDRVGNILNRKDTNVLEKGVQIFGQGAGLAANTLEQTAMKVPGVKQTFEKVGEGINWLATSELSPIKHLGDIIGSNKTLQEVVRLYDTDKNFKDTVDGVTNIVRLGGDVDAAVNSANFAANVTNKVIRDIKTSTGKTSISETKTPIVEEPSSVQTIAQNTSENIMNKVARLNPSDANKFEKLAGKTHGQYLVETGNFGTPDQIVTKEAIKFTQSLNSVDDALSKLPGRFKDASITEALKGLEQRASSVASGDIKAPYQSLLDDLIKKNNSVGLTMEEINQVKRLFEKEVKLGYNKLINADKVQQATNIDNALRKWQVGQAEELGFKNISELNKQTQLSKFIIDKLGSQIIGKLGLNGISLTDWIVLSGGNPQAIAGFLVKKFFSSKGVQANIAKLLNSLEAKGLITPEIVQTQIKNLPAPTTEVRSSIGSGKPIKIAPKGSNIDIVQ